MMRLVTVARQISVTVPSGYPFYTQSVSRPAAKRQCPILICAIFHQRPHLITNPVGK
jgi:hypothetical protein